MTDGNRYIVPVFGVTGWKNSGKTRLTTRLIAHFTAKGLRVGAIKHAHHSFEIDHEGRDSYNMRRAGARQVAVVSQFRWALISELQPEPEPDFARILQQFEGFDLVLVEGYKQLDFPKIETRSHLQETQQILARGRDDIIAIASDRPLDEEGDRLLDEGDDGPRDLPRFDPADIEGIAAFIAQRLALVGGN